MVNDPLNVEHHEHADESLLLDVGVPYRMIGDQLYLESQAHHGVQCWLRNFPKVTLCAPVLPEALVDRSMDWVPAGSLLEHPGFDAAPFPWGYGIQSHIRHASEVRRVLRTLIPRHRWLCYANLGWLGAWGRLAAEESFRLRRPFSIWLDWALHEMPMRQDTSRLKRIWRRTERAIQTRLVLRDVRRAALGLFNGKTVFDAYSGISRNPRVVHDVHLTENEIIPIDRLNARLSRSEGPHRILYVGRVHEMKGPQHWLNAVAALISQHKGPRKIIATWIGDGPLLEQMRREVASRGLSEYVKFTGIERDRAKVVAALRDADLFAFCHVTPESPRVLIEALMSGLPLVGFASSYADELLRDYSAAGSFVPTGDSAALAGKLADCLHQPERLARMTEAARLAGTGYSDIRVFKHRSDLIKEFL